MPEPLSSQKSDEFRSGLKNINISRLVLDTASWGDSLGNCDKERLVSSPAFDKPFQEVSRRVAAR